MTKPLLSELVTPPSHDLLAIACRAVTPDADGNLVVDKAGAAVLADAVVEMGWHHDAVMMLVVGVPMDGTANPYVSGSKAHKRWAWRRQTSMTEVQEHADAYRASAYGVWAKATLAVLLFGDWPASKRVCGRVGVMRTRSPFPLLRSWARRLGRGTR